MSNTILYPDNALLVDPARVDMSERERTELGDIPAFAESLQMFGVLQLPLVTDHPDRPGFLLPITGGRRLTTYAYLGLTEYPVAYRPSIPRSQFKEMELEENEQRLQMTWQEKVKCIAKSHQLRVSLALDRNHIWTQRNSGSVFGCSHTHVGNCILLYEYIIAGDTAIINSPTVGDALEVLIQRQEDRAQAELARRAASQMFIASPILPATASASPVDPAFAKAIPKFLTKPSTPSVAPGFLAPQTNGQPPSGQPGFQDQPQAAQPEMKRFQLSKRFFLGDCLAFMEESHPNRFDHIVTDPPYGIDLKNMEKIQDIGTVADQHQVEANLVFLQQFIPLVHKVLRPNGYFVMWYDLDNHEKVQGWARAAGFKVQRWPLTWHKLHNCKNDAAQYNFTKTTEFAMVCRKGNGTLVKPTATSVVAVDGLLEQQKYNNPFAKPFQVWKFIYDAIALPGQEIYDPCGGEFSAAMAAINCGLLPTANEIEEVHYTKGLNSVRALLEKATGGNIIFE